MGDVEAVWEDLAVAQAVEILRALAPAKRLEVWREACAPEVCVLAGCARFKERYRPYCSGHQKRYARYGDPLAHIPLGKTVEVRRAADALRA